MDDPSLCVTIPVAAKSLGISAAKAYLLAAAGELPTVRFGRAIRVPLDELKTWLRQRSATPHPPTNTLEKLPGGCRREKPAAPAATNGAT